MQKELNSTLRSKISSIRVWGMLCWWPCQGTKKKKSLKLISLTVTAPKILYDYLQDEATFLSLITLWDFHLGRHCHLLFRTTWESSAMLLRLHHFHPLKGHILVMTAIPPVQFRSWMTLCCKSPKNRSVTEIYSAVFSDAAFANSVNWRVGFHQLVKPSELICKWNKVKALSDGYK